VQELNETDIYEQVNKYDRAPDYKPVRKYENVNRQPDAPNLVAWSPYEPVGNDRSSMHQYDSDDTKMSPNQPVREYEMLMNKTKNEVSPYESVNDNQPRQHSSNEEIPKYNPSLSHLESHNDDIGGCKKPLLLDTPTSNDYEPVEKYRVQNKIAEQQLPLLQNDNTIGTSNDYEPVEKYRVKNDGPGVGERPPTTTPQQYNPYDTPISDVPEKKNFDDLYAKVDRSSKKSNR